MNATTAAARVNRKQTRAEVDGQIQKSIPMYLQAALCQCFERMSHALRWGDVFLRDDPVTGNERLFLKVGSSRAYQDYDQEQGEHPLLPGAVRLNKFFAKYGPSEAKKAYSLSEIWMDVCCFFATIAVLILGKLCSNHYEDSKALIGAICALIFSFIFTTHERALHLKNNRAGPEQSMKIDDQKINQSINDNRLIIVD